MAGTERITKERIRKAIMGSWGQINKVAQRAGCSVKTVERKLSKHADLRKLLDKEKDMLAVLTDELSDNALLDTLMRKTVNAETEWTRQDEDRRVKVAMWVKDRNSKKNGEVEDTGEHVLHVFVNDLDGSNARSSNAAVAQS